jgi:hypothetical protein
MNESAALFKKGLSADHISGWLRTKKPNEPEK